MMVRRVGWSDQRQTQSALSAKLMVLVTVVLLGAIGNASAQQDSPMGSCEFVNQWTGETCMEFHGPGWTSESMEERCLQESGGVTIEGAACPKPDFEFAGLCSKSVDDDSGAATTTEGSAIRIEATAMMITDAADCSFNSMSCETFLGGIFDASEACADDDFFEDADILGEVTASNTQCDTSPDALTDALSKLLNDTTTKNDYSRVVEHTCIDNTGYRYTDKRCFYTYIPDCATVDSPLVYDIHGVSLCPLWNFETTGWIQKAIEQCFVIVWPVGNTDPTMSAFSCFALEGGYDTTDAAKQHQGDGGDDVDVVLPGIEYETEDCCCFNFNGPRSEPSVFDDLTFLRNVAAVAVDEVSTRTNGAVTIDATRIYMGGHSNGCAAGLAMAATHSDMVAAVCCHSPALITPFPDDGSYEPVPIWLTHGKMDGTVEYHGAFPDGTDAPKYNPGAEQMNSLLGIANGCTAMSSNAGVDSTPTSNGSYTYYTQENCGNGSAVKLLSLDTAGHTPFLGADLFQGDYDGAVVATVDTTQHAWEFCSSHSKSTEPVLELVKPATTAIEQQQDEVEEQDDASSDGSSSSSTSSTTQDVIDAWKEENSEYASSSVSTAWFQNPSIVISVSVVAALSELFV